MMTNVHFCRFFSFSLIYCWFLHCRLNNLSRDIDRAGSLFISVAEKDDILSIVKDMSDEIDTTSRNNSNASSGKCNCCKGWTCSTQ